MVLVQAEDVTPVRTRISWGAIIAGAAVAFSLHFLLSLLGAAVGLSVRDTIDPQNLKMSAAAYAIGVTALCLFVGGYVASLLTAGENRSESLLYGVLVWAVVFVGLIVLAASGMRTGIGAMSGLATAGQTATGGDWEAAARRAGVPQERIDDLKRQATEARRAAEDPANQAAATEAVTRASWYAFFGTWIAMLAAALGGYVGSGPQFRVFTVRTTGSTIRPATV